MTEDHESKDVLEHAPVLQEEVAELNRGASVKFSHYVFIFILNLILLISLMAVAWYGVGRQYLLSLENRLSATVTTKDTVQLSEIKELKNRLGEIHQQLEELKSNIAAAESNRQDYIELQRRIDAIQLKIDQKKITAIGNGSEEKWKYSLVTAIEMGLPLEVFRRNASIPEDVRERMEGIDFIPTYKNISEEWSVIRDGIRLQANAEKSLSPATNDLWNNFKIFVKRIFRIRRLDENNLTQEEIFVRHIDKLLVEHKVEDLVQCIEMYQPRFEMTTKQVIITWANKLEKFLRGQLILEMVKKY